MEFIFSHDARWLWTAALGVLLFFPVRHLIWSLSIRRAEAKHGPTDEDMRRRLKKRAGFTSALLCFVFAIIYSNVVFKSVT